jgi:8-oxo-dGTP pyrophosphatase MutT (NUDIX family)
MAKPTPADSQSNPWTTKSTIQRFENPWIKVIENDVIHPDGSDGKYTIVDFQKIAVAILPVDAHGNTWLVGQYRYAHHCYEWEIPEGGSDPGEDTKKTALRELQEETGLIATHLEPILEMQLSNSVTSEISISYLASGLTETKPCPDPSEKLQIRKLPLSEAIEMVMDGQIRDALSIATLLKAQLILGKG